MHFYSFLFSLDIPNPNVLNRKVTLVNSGILKIIPLHSVDQVDYQELKPKTIADSMEGLIGGVLVDSGIRNATLFMKYVGIYSDEYKIDLETEQKNWFNNYNPLEQDLTGKLKDFVDDMYNKYDFKSLEEKIDYKFKNKGLLIEAFKHPSYTRHDLVYPSYEKIEFLGKISNSF